jgi:YfiH family protein
MTLPDPQLQRVASGDLAIWTDVRLEREAGVIVAFSERTGGVSLPPFASLNLAAHVGDAPRAVDTNRERLLSAVGIPQFLAWLTVPSQTHGHVIAQVGDSTRGSGARAASGLPPLACTDALVTAEQGVPLMLCFADCVPVVLVAPGPVVAVVHAGWRGALAALPGVAVRSACGIAGCDASEIRAYIGPHIRACHYKVDDTIMSQFVNTFGTLARADSGGLDLEFAVTASLIDAGVARCSIARLGTCTAEASDRFFSYRAEQGLTGRHAAIACILPRA